MNVFDLGHVRGTPLGPCWSNEATDSLKWTLNSVEIENIIGNTLSSFVIIIIDIMVFARAGTNQYNNTKIVWGK